MRDRILIVDDDGEQARMLEGVLRAEGLAACVETSSPRALERLTEERFDCVLADLRMPDIDGVELFEQARDRVDGDLTYVIMTAYGSIETAVDAVRAGVFDFIQKPINVRELLAVLHRARVMRSLKRENVELRSQVAAKSLREEIIGKSNEMTRLLEQVEMAANSEATILLRGESGTGKELIANHIHYTSPRSEGPFVKVNCGAIPETLLEDELFGHDKGAFTGAYRRRAGRFERASGGTLFLDEISEMPPPLQVKLLRVLQEREVERLGGDEPIRVDVRILLATHRDLEALLAEGGFREDLYYRINVVSLTIPPLRDRRDDILLLAHHFLKRSAKKNHREPRGDTPEAERLLRDYSWPGNVRELENCIERAVVMSSGEQIGAEDLSFFRRADRGGAVREEVLGRFLQDGLPLDELEREYIRLGLEEARGNQSRAAKLLGISRRTLQYRAEKYGLLGRAEPRAAGGGAP